MIQALETARLVGEAKEKLGKPLLPTREVNRAVFVGDTHTAVDVTQTVFDKFYEDADRCVRNSRASKPGREPRRPCGVPAALERPERHGRRVHTKRERRRSILLRKRCDQAVSREQPPEGNHQGPRGCRRVQGRHGWKSNHRLLKPVPRHISRNPSPEPGPDGEDPNMTLSARTELSHRYSYDSRFDAVFKVTLVAERR